MTFLPQVPLLMALLAGSQDFEFTIAPNQQHCELGAMVNIKRTILTLTRFKA
jgi:hypothetical protein